MNGRVYDPELARFLSPDPYVQMPDFSQNFNRYSYVLNNPLKYTDPSGEIIWFVVAAAAIGGAINVATHWDQIDSFGEGLTAFGIGAAAGGLAVATGGAALTAYGGVSFVSGAVAAGIGYTFNSLTQTIGNGIAFGDTPPTMQQFAVGLGSSMLLGGTISGTQAAMNGNNFWSGQPQAFGRGPFSFNNTPTAPPPGRIEAGPVQGLKNVPGPSSNLPAKINLPPNNGALGSSEMKYLYKGEIIDRFGETTKYSRYLSPEGTSIPARSLPPSTNLNLRNVYQVVKPFPVQSSTIAPYYGMPGMGTQYVTPLPIQLMLDKGILIKYTIPIH